MIIYNKINLRINNKYVSVEDLGVTESLKLTGKTTMDIQAHDGQ